MDGESEFDGKPIPPFMKEIVSSQLDVEGWITSLEIKPTPEHRLAVLILTEFSSTAHRR